MLLIACKVTVTAPDGSSIIAKALIDPGSSASLVHERLAQHLSLLHSGKNATVVLRISSENLGRSIHTEEYNLGFIPVSLKGDQLADLKLADSDFRTPACLTCC